MSWISQSTNTQPNYVDNWAAYPLAVGAWVYIPSAIGGNQMCPMSNVGNTNSFLSSGWEVDFSYTRWHSQTSNQFALSNYNKDFAWVSGFVYTNAWFYLGVSFDAIGRASLFCYNTVTRQEAYVIGSAATLQFNVPLINFNQRASVNGGTGMQVAEVAIWQSAFGLTEWRELASGRHTLRFNREGLRTYLPLERSFHNVIGATDKWQHTQTTAYTWGGRPPLLEHMPRRLFSFRSQTPTILYNATLPNLVDATVLAEGVSATWAASFYPVLGGKDATTSSLRATMPLPGATISVREGASATYASTFSRPTMASVSRHGVSNSLATTHTRPIMQVPAGAIDGVGSNQLNVAFSQGNVGYVNTGTAFDYSQSTTAYSTGKYYVEFQTYGYGATTFSLYAGLVTTGSTAYHSATNFISVAAGSVGQYVAPSTFSSGTGGANGTLGMALDLDNRVYWWRIGAGVWNGSASNNPVTGVGGISFSSVAGPYYLAFQNQKGSGQSFTGAACYTGGTQPASGSTSYNTTAPAGFGNWTVSLLIQSIMREGVTAAEIATLDPPATTVAVTFVVPSTQSAIAMTLNQPITIIQALEGEIGSMTASLPSPTLAIATRQAAIASMTASFPLPGFAATSLECEAASWIATLPRPSLTGTSLEGEALDWSSAMTRPLLLASSASFTPIVIVMTMARPATTITVAEGVRLAVDPTLAKPALALAARQIAKAALDMSMPEPMFRATMYECETAAWASTMALPAMTFAANHSRAVSIDMLMAKPVEQLVAKVGVRLQLVPALPQVVMHVSTKKGTMADVGMIMARPVATMTMREGTIATMSVSLSKPVETSRIVEGVSLSIGVPMPLPRLIVESRQAEAATWAATLARSFLAGAARAGERMAASVALARPSVAIGVTAKSGVRVAMTMPQVRETVSLRLGTRVRIVDAMARPTLFVHVQCPVQMEFHMTFPRPGEHVASRIGERGVMSSLLIRPVLSATAHEIEHATVQLVMLMPAPIERTIAGYFHHDVDPHRTVHDGAGSRIAIAQGPLRVGSGSASVRQTAEE